MKNTKLPKISESDIEKETHLSHIEIENIIKYIQGKVLTVVEAIALNPIQLKATKDLVKHIFSEQLTRLYNETHPNCTMLGEADMVMYSGSVDKFQEENTPTNYK